MLPQLSHWHISTSNTVPNERICAGDTQNVYALHTQPFMVEHVSKIRTLYAWSNRQFQTRLIIKPSTYYFKHNQTLHLLFRRPSDEYDPGRGKGRLISHLLLTPIVCHSTIFALSLAAGRRASSDRYTVSVQCKHRPSGNVNTTPPSDATQIDLHNQPHAPAAS